MEGRSAGYLVISDITGYTVYLNETELEHARETLTDLLAVLVDGTRPPLVLSGLEGDAVFSYAVEAGFLEGQTFVELIESTYVAFRKAIDLKVLNNTCQCNACANVSSLDLKFFVHFGEFTLSSVGPVEELMGSDVNLIHRLLKNSVVSETGVAAYCLYTEAARARLGIEALTDLVPHSEDVPDFGRMDVWVQDMLPRYEESKKGSEIVLGEDEVLFAVEAEIAIPPAALWDYLSSTDFRTILIGSDSQRLTDRQRGRVAPGSAYICYHGDQVLPQVVLEWRPFTKIVTEDTMGRPMRGTFLAVIELTATDQGTHLTRTVGRVKGSPFHRFVAERGIRRTAPRKVGASLRRFQQAVEADWAKRGGGLAGVQGGP